MKTAKEFGSYGEFEFWLLKKVSKPFEMAYFHEHWFYEGSIRNALAETEKERLSSWMSIFLEFKRFSKVRLQVGCRKCFLKKF